MALSVQWSPSPNWNQRDRRFPLQGDVSHRIVGTAPSALSLFSRPGTASSHFVIGHTQQGDLCPRCGPVTGARGSLVIWQCVDLALMAWTNGDVRDPTWPGYQAGVNPNLTTITTEHEDMGAAGGHQVTDHVWEASRELKKLLRSGNLLAIRAAGIRVGDGAFSASALVARLAALPATGATYIDHHQIAGPNKPWCWRNFDLDVGFPSRLPGLLAYLAAPEADVPYQTRPVREKWNVAAGTVFWVGGPGQGEQKSFTTPQQLWSNGESVDGLWRRIEYHDTPSIGEELWIWRRAMNSLGGRNPASGFGPPTPTVDCTVQVNDARKATASHAEAQTQAWVATRPPIVPLVTDRG